MNSRLRNMIILCLVLCVSLTGCFGAELIADGIL